MTESEQDAQRHLMNLAFQYHVAGRCAAKCQLALVTGNLLHHAIEMVLKALLVQDLGLRGLAKMGHNLSEIWVACVTKHPGLDAPERTRAIGDLDRFERLRYPDGMVAAGAAIRFGWERGPSMPAMNVPVYDLAMEDVDELFHATFLVGGKNPDFFLAMLNQEARATLRERNRYPLGTDRF
jgi:hypothetical protein